MEIDIAPQYAGFREEVRTWLSEHLVGEFAEHRGIGSPTDDTAWDVRVAWERELSAGKPRLANAVLNLAPAAAKR